MIYILTSEANNKRYFYLQEIYQFWYVDAFTSIIVNSLTFLYLLKSSSSVTSFFFSFFFCLSCKSQKVKDGFNINDFCKVVCNYFIRRRGSFNKLFVCACVFELTWEGLPFDAICDYHNVTVDSCTERMKFERSAPSS